MPWLAVADTGQGIPPPNASRVFDRFYRRATSGWMESMGQTTPGDGAGSGLGLAIVRATPTGMALRSAPRQATTDPLLPGPGVA